MLQDRRAYRAAVSTLTVPPEVYICRSRESSGVNGRKLTSLSTRPKTPTNKGVGSQALLASSCESKFGETWEIVCDLAV